MEQTLGWIVDYHASDGRQVSKEEAKYMPRESLVKEFTMQDKNSYEAAHEGFLRISENYLKMDVEGFLGVSERYLNTKPDALDRMMAVSIDYLLNAA